MNLFGALLAICVSGAFGGVTSYLVHHAFDENGKHRIRGDFINPFERKIPILTNALIGISGAISLQTIILSTRIYDTADGQSVGFVSNYIFIISMSLVGGFGARVFLTKISSALEKKLADLERQNREAKETIKELKADRGLKSIATNLKEYLNDKENKNNLQYAALMSEKEIESNPKYWEFYFIKSRAHKLLGQFSRAIDTLNEYVEIRGAVKEKDQILCTAYYNLACYCCGLFGESRDPAHRLHAIQYFSLSLKYSNQTDVDILFARSDSDLAAIINDPIVLQDISKYEKAPG